MQISLTINVERALMPVKALGSIVASVIRRVSNAASPSRNLESPPRLPNHAMACTSAAESLGKLAVRFQPHEQDIDGAGEGPSRWEVSKNLELLSMDMTIASRYTSHAGIAKKVNHVIVELDKFLGDENCSRLCNWVSDDCHGCERSDVLTDLENVRAQLELIRK